MHGQISQEIEFDGTSDSYLKILQVHYNASPDTDDYTTAYFKHLRRAPILLNPHKL